ncbi:MAG: type 1 glutamine amidotransferase [Pseudomonadota bacterium]
MTRILIAEGNTPELCARRDAARLPNAAEGYGLALQHFAPDLEIAITRPYFDGWRLEEVDLAGIDGFVVTGSGVAWSGADARARPFWELYGRVFEAGIPALGSCWGLQTAAVALGGDTEAGPNGMEQGFARGVTLTEAGAQHPMHRGRGQRFDVLAMHRDDVTRVPTGAVVTASNAHTAVQGMVYEAGDTQFWGVQYHPEINLTDVAYYFSRDQGTFAGHAVSLDEASRDLHAVVADPAGETALRHRYAIGDELLDHDVHGLELKNWLAHKVLAG